MRHPGSPIGVVGVVGVGAMGGAFAKHVMASGRRVVVCDVDRERTALAEAFGCEVVDDPARLLEAASVLLLSLPSEAAFADVVASLAAQPPPRAHAVVADTSTLALDAKEAGRAALGAVGLTLVDCPVSGTGVQAQHGDVVVYASGPEDALDLCEPVLRAFARAVHRAGPFGAGSRLKFLANLLVAVHTAAAAEMLVLARRAGVDPAAALAAALDGAGGSRMLEVRGPGMVQRAYAAGAPVRLWRKDLAIIERFARDAGAATPLFDAAADVFARADEAGWTDHDAAAVQEVYLDMSTEAAG